MFDGEDIQNIVQYFREQVEPSPLESAKGILLPKNDILMSYIISAVAFSRQPLVDVLREIDALREWLRIAQEEHRPEPGKELPILPEGVTYESQLDDIANALQFNSRYILFGEGSKSKGGSLLAALPDQQIHAYPSGEETAYISLKSEIPANVSILNPSYSTLLGGSVPIVYVRQNSIIMASALFEILKDTPEFEGLESISSDDFEYNAYGIAVAHEVGKAVTSKTQSSAKAAEAAALKCTKAFLEENKVQPEFFNAYCRIMGIPEDI